jgi:hypothetical protein
MRKSLQFAVVLVAALGLAGAAEGAVLTSASISIPFGKLGALPPITGTGVGTSLGSGATATLGANVLHGTVIMTGLTSSPPITQVVISLSGHAAGSFTPAGGPGGGLGGTMTLAGAAKILAYTGNLTLVEVPLWLVGQPATYGSDITFPTWGTGWTTGVQTLMAPATTTGGGTATPQTVTATGADLRTAGGAGTLVLITPMYIETYLVAVPDVLTFATLTLNYVPEPSTLVLVGLGIAGLALQRRPRA